MSTQAQPKSRTVKSVELKGRVLTVDIRIQVPFGEQTAPLLEKNFLFRKLSRRKRIRYLPTLPLTRQLRLVTYHKRVRIRQVEVIELGPATAPEPQPRQVLRPALV